MNHLKIYTVMLLPLFSQTTRLFLTTSMLAKASQPAVLRQLACTANLALWLGYSAAAQNVPMPASVPTGDKLLYGRHSPNACASKRKKSQPMVQASNCLSPHELHAKRQQYQNQHREEFPAIYQPGVQ
jgi:hypothetical protein